jgi:hypothetical protein
MTAHERNEVERAMDCLEQMPCGGIGADGASQTELDEASEQGDAFDKDAIYHTAQQAWLILNEILKPGETK